jgi:hypothetical protein
MAKLWRKSRAKKTRTVHFALGTATVRLISYFDYNDDRVYWVTDVKTGHEDLVGVEFLLP